MLVNETVFLASSMTKAINKRKRTPGAILGMGIFQEHSIKTKSVRVSEKDGNLVLIPNTPRTAPASVATSKPRTSRLIEAMHFAYEDALYAEDYQDVLVYEGDARADIPDGTPPELAAVMVIRNDKLADMAACHDATWEQKAVGALMGSILDSDGTTEILNLYTEFGVTEQVEYLDLAGTPDVMGSCIEIIEKMTTALGVYGYQYPLAICGKTLFKALRSNSDVQASFAYGGDAVAELLRTNPAGKFMYGDIIWQLFTENAGGVTFVPDGEARVFPVGAPIFNRYNAPGTFNDTVNTIGVPIYVKSRIMDYDKGIGILTESNPIFLCSKPAACIKIDDGAAP